mgnify:CR=1 FL=1
MTPPIASPVSGYAHSIGHRVVATVLVVVLAVALVRAAPSILAREDGSGPWLLLILGVGLLGTYFTMVTARTTLDADGIVQSGLPHRQARWEEIAVAYVGGLPFARRLRVRLHSGRRLSFAGAGPQLKAAFEQVAAACVIR